MMLYAIELYPTSVKSLGTGTVNVFGKFGTLLNQDVPQPPSSIFSPSRWTWIPCSCMAVWVWWPWWRSVFCLKARTGLSWTKLKKSHNWKLTIPWKLRRKHLKKTLNKIDLYIKLHSLIRCRIAGRWHFRTSTVWAHCIKGLLGIELRAVQRVAVFFFILYSVEPGFFRLGVPETEFLNIRLDLVPLIFTLEVIQVKNPNFQREGLILLQQPIKEFLGQQGILGLLLEIAQNGKKCRCEIMGVQHKVFVGEFRQCEASWAIKGKVLEGFE